MSTSTPTPRRRLTTEKLARRKRAVAACQFCRLRKTKCDGVKPVCGFCQRLDAQCIWSDHSLENRYESTPAEHEILQRLDELKALLQNSNAVLPGSSTVEGAANASSEPPARPPSPTTAASYPSNLSSVSPSIPSNASARCESMLHWPVFRESLEPSEIAIESFVLEDDHFFDTSPSSFTPTLSGPPKKLIASAYGLQENHFVPLCRKFLVHVHPRNPILEGGELMQYAKRAAEDGLGWDGPSCLVLIACALGFYTSPWSTDAAELSRTCGAFREVDNIAAEAYYLAAQKRIGLLGWSLVDIQCLFFASVYEKYSFRPLQAWFYIQQASLRLQAYLKRQQRLDLVQEGHPNAAWDHQLQHRVFWSIFKAENELLIELPFKSSGIEELARSDSMFPSPPAIPTTLDAETPASPDGLDSWQNERSWFFYLAEIALRRTINDTVWLFRLKGEHYWMTHIVSLEQQHEEAEKQISLWYSHLPDCIRFDPAAEPDNELSFYLQGRFYEWRDHILRPFLYYVLHRNATQAMTPRILSCAQQCVLACANGIPYYDRHHRHGGTWFVCRAMFTFAMTILAVVIGGDQDLRPPTDWDALLDTAISMLRRWESQASDVGVMRSLLERLVTTVHVRLGTGL